MYPDDPINNILKVVLYSESVNAQNKSSVFISSCNKDHRFDALEPTKITSHEHHQVQGL